MTTSWQSFEFELFQLFLRFCTSFIRKPHKWICFWVYSYKGTLIQVLFVNKSSNFVRKSKFVRIVQTSKMVVFGSVLPFLVQCTLFLVQCTYFWFGAHRTQTQNSVCQWSRLKTQTEVISPLYRSILQIWTFFFSFYTFIWKPLICDHQEELHSEDPQDHPKLFICSKSQ